MHIRVYNYIYVILGQKGLDTLIACIKTAIIRIIYKKMKIEFNLNFIVQVFKTPIKVEQYTVLHVIKKNNQLCSLHLLYTRARPSFKTIKQLSHSICIKRSNEKCRLDRKFQSMIFTLPYLFFCK